jgi:hypothetical protein
MEDTDLAQVEAQLGSKLTPVRKPLGFGCVGLYVRVRGRMEARSGLLKPRQPIGHGAHCYWGLSPARTAIHHPMQRMNNGGLPNRSIKYCGATCRCHG